MALEKLVRPGSGPTLVLLHGLGADEFDLFDLGGLAPDDWQIVSLRAPHRYPPGYSWFPIDWTETGLDIDVEGAKASAELVIKEVSEYDQPVVMGFSQGAMLVWLALLAGAPFRAAAMFSGAPLEEGTAPAEIPTLVVHGRHDPVVPFAYGRKLAALQGPNGTILETDDAHGIGMEAQSAFAAWLRKFANPSPSHR